MAQTWLQETIKVRLREWLTHDLMDQWLKPRRAYLLTQTGEAGANPDQYIQADARHLAISGESRETSVWMFGDF